MATKLLCLATCYMPVGTRIIEVAAGRSGRTTKEEKEIVDRFEDDEIHEVADDRVSAYLASGNFVRAGDD